MSEETCLLFRLPPNPPHIRPLRDDDATMLRSLDPDLPRSPADCVTCGGSPDYLDGEYGTFRWYDDARQIVEYECDCIAQYQLRMWLTNCGVGLHYQRYGWSDAIGVSKAAQEAVLDYAEHVEENLRGGYGLILHGIIQGTGKTLLATLLLKTIVAAGVDGYFTTFTDMLNAVSAGWRNEDQRRWFERRVRNAGFLVVDDVGRESKQETMLSRGERESAGLASGILRTTRQHAETTYEEVIRHRVNSEKPTIVTTNLTMEQMEQGYNSNVMSLLSESCLPVEVLGMDYRRRAAQRKADEMRQGLSRPVMLA